MSATGEQPAARETTVGEKSIFDWKAITVAVTLAFAAGSAHFRIGANETATAEVKTSCAAVQAQVTGLDKNAATKADVEKLGEKLDAMNNQLIALTAIMGAAVPNRTANANYRPQPRGGQ